MAEFKETAAQRSERLKRAKNAWECMDEIRSFARNGFESIPAEWLGTYFRSWGIYTQGDGAGALGGTGGQGKAVPYFMVRIRIPNGILRSRQLQTIADIVERHARGVADISVRQNIQLHWVPIESIPEIFETLWQVGLTTVGACGDVARNVVGCPVAGVDQDEICDSSGLVREATRLLAGNEEFYNLPRKFKIAITGCRVWCCYPEINDIGLTALKRKRRSGEEVGFSLRVGGGLSTDPLFAQRLNAFVAWNQVLPVVRAIAEIFRESSNLRESRERARLKFLFLRHGWTIDTFLSALEERLGFRLDEAEPEEAPVDVLRDHVGCHQQKQPGLYYIGASVLRGRITSAQLRTAAEVAQKYASGDLRTTTMQNLLLLNVPRVNVAEVADRLTLTGLPVEGSVFQRGTVACTGTEFCKLAITETKDFARWLTEELDERLPGFEQQLRLHITGCPNSCGQHWIADIGIEGKKLKVDGQWRDAYYFCVGGGVGRFQAFARPIGYRCLASEVPDAIERLLNQFELLREGDENLRQFLHRHGSDEVRSWLAGSIISAVERDLPSSTTPHGVEG
ncbi:MAG TPA: nitrite reductase [Terriglobales bacterium]|nr:nitrite reductase [Terriglobales bacterium]